MVIELSFTHPEHGVTNKLTKICFGILSDKRGLEENYPLWIFDKCVQVQYHLFPENIVLFKKYVSYLIEQNILKEVDITYTTNEREVIASCSTELPGQEIVGKFELLRSGKSDMYCSRFISLYEMCTKELTRINSKKRDWTNFERRFIQKTALIHTLNIISLCRIVPIGNSILEAFCYFPELHVFDPAKSRKITKSWRESIYFYGVHIYFMGSATESVLKKVHVTDLVVPETDKKYFWLIGGSEPVPDKELSTVFAVYIKNCLLRAN